MVILNSIIKIFIKKSGVSKKLNCIITIVYAARMLIFVIKSKAITILKITPNEKQKLGSKKFDRLGYLFTNT